MQDLLVTIPGIGKLTAAKLLGEIRNIQDFQSARQLAAYAGLTPRNFLSGTSVHKKSRLSKTGNAHLRKLLFMPAITAKRWNPIVHTFCDRLILSGLRPMEVIGAAMRKLIHLVFGILKSGRPFDPNYLTNLHPLP
jgi:transposase